MADKRSVLAAELFKRALDRPAEQRAHFWMKRAQAMWDCAATWNRSSNSMMMEMDF